MILVDKASFEKASLKAEKTSVDSLPDTVIATELATELAADEKSSLPSSVPYIMGALGVAITGLGIAYLARRWHKNRKNSGN